MTPNNRNNETVQQAEAILRRMADWDAAKATIPQIRWQIEAQAFATSLAIEAGFVSTEMLTAIRTALATHDAEAMEDDL